MNNFVLTGMPGVGKSTAGILLAKATGLSFIDTDLLLQRRHGMLLQPLLNHYGLDGFLSIEEQVILSLDPSDHVIATGGSVVYSQASMAHLRKLGIVFYLDLPLADLGHRLSNIASRGVVMPEGIDLGDLYTERKPLYEKYADIRVDCADKDLETVVEEISSHIKKLSSP